MRLNMSWPTLTVSVHSGDGSRWICTHARRNFFLSFQTDTLGVDVEGDGRGRSYCVVCSSSQPHNLSQTLYSVMETFLLMCHETARPPQSCTALPTNPIKKTLRQGNTNKIPFLLTLLVRAALYHPPQFLWREAYLWTIIWHHVHIPPTRCSLVICCVCSPPCYVTQWAAFFVCRFPPPSTHKHIDHVSHKVHSADGGCWLRGKSHHMIVGTAPRRKPPFLSKGRNRQCFVDHIEGVYPFY